MSDGTELPEDLIATAVTWSQRAELPLESVNEAIEWVLGELKANAWGYGRATSPRVQVNLQWPSYDALRKPGYKFDKHFKGYVGGELREFALVISDRPLTVPQADKVLREHYRLQEEVTQTENAHQDSHGGDG